jgi:hypothetical protein
LGYGGPWETPATRNVGSRAVGLGNIDMLISEVTSMYGRKPLWITEYGYQTKPPDDFFGVTWTKQAEYLRQASGSRKRTPVSTSSRGSCSRTVRHSKAGNRG